MRLNQLFCLLLLLLPLPAAALEKVSFPTDKLAIRTGTATLQFTVEVATTPAQHQYGLMNRETLPRMHGMIFLFEPEKQVSFWMKDTLLPLDMLFIDSKGVIKQIAPNAQPESTALIPSEGPVRAVLELEGGSAAKYHIATGDKVIYSVFP